MQRPLVTRTCNAEGPQLLIQFRDVEQSHPFQGVDSAVVRRGAAASIPNINERLPHSNEALSNLHGTCASGVAVFVCDTSTGILVWHHVVGARQ